MDFDDAIMAHTRWKYRLADYIDGKCADHLDAADVGSEDRCELGKWISEQRHSPVLVELKRAHASFHATAGRIVSLAQTGRIDEARAALLSPTGYRTESARVVRFITQLQLASYARSSLTAS